jgi:hypothetical protein
MFKMITTAALSLAALGVVVASHNPALAISNCVVPRVQDAAPGSLETPIELSPEESAEAYMCVKSLMTTAYAKAGISDVLGYTSWTKVNTAPYLSGTMHANNYANKKAAAKYSQFEKGAPFDVGSIIVKDFFTVDANGDIKPGPMFIVQKMGAHFNAKSGDWRYTKVNVDGTIAGTTNGENAAAVEACAVCHEAAKKDDYMFFVPKEYRVK